MTCHADAVTVCAHVAHAAPAWGVLIVPVLVGVFGIVPAFFAGRVRNTV